MYLFSSRLRVVRVGIDTGRYNDAMVSLNHILRKCKGGYELTRPQEKINHLMYMVGIKLFAKTEKELKTLFELFLLSLFADPNDMDSTPCRGGVRLPK